MLADSDAAGVVNGVRNCGGYRTNAGFAEALHSVEPARLQTIEIKLRHLRDVHDRRQPVGQIPDAVMTRTWKFSIPRNRIGCHLRTFDKRSDHIGFGDKWIDDKAGVVRIYRTDESPIARPRIHFHFHKAGAYALVRCSPFTTGNSTAELTNNAIVRLCQCGKGCRLLRIVTREDRAIADLQAGSVDLQEIR